MYLIPECAARPKLVQRRFPLQLFLIGIGIALLLAGLFFNMGAVDAQTMPTPDRLAQPTLPASPSQADKGAQVYWLTCLPCHGDRGQGLTEEFKETYPEEDRNCWNSGCHGNRPYESGFTLPKVIPAVIGSGTLQKFPNALVLRSYIFATMPWWKPASLTEEETWQVTAFLLRENDLWTTREELTESNSSLILVAAPMAAATPQPSVSTVSPRTISLLLLFSIGCIILMSLVFLRKPKS
jgi:mono/diheme cytochrome c family protein